MSFDIVTSKELLKSHWSPASTPFNFWGARRWERWGNIQSWGNGFVITAMNGTICPKFEMDELLKVTSASQVVRLVQWRHSMCCRFDVCFQTCLPHPSLWWVLKRLWVDRAQKMVFRILESAVTQVVNENECQAQVHLSTYIKTFLDSDNSRQPNNIIRPLATVLQ